MNAKSLALSAATLIGLVASVASAQSQSQAPQYPLTQNVPYSSHYSGYGYYDHASTLEEGMANGIANIMHAAGASNLLHAQASRHYQEAYSRALDNRTKSIETYFASRRINREAVAAERGPRVTPEQVQRIVKERAPQRLTANELDPQTGRILWPALLEDDMYRADREQLDELVYKWVRFKGKIAPNEYLALQQSVKTMQVELKQHVRQYSSADYMKAKNVLEGLAYEVNRREAALARGETDDAGFLAIR